MGILDAIQPMSIDWPVDSTNGVITMVVFGVISLIAFVLSYRSNPKEDGTPVGLKLLFALIAAGWNIVYIGYYFFTVHVMGM
jgi:hypothetical protein